MDPASVSRVCADLSVNWHGDSPGDAHPAAAPAEDETPATVMRDHSDLGRLLSVGVVLLVLIVLTVVIATKAPLLALQGGLVRGQHLRQNHAEGAGALLLATVDHGGLS